MKFIDMFSGQQGTIISSLILLPILILMCLITLNLYKQRKKTSYFTLSVALFLTLIDHGLTISQVLTGNPHVPFLSTPLVSRGITVLGDCAIIIMIIGFYQLYYFISTKVQRLVFGVCGLTAAMTFFFPKIEHITKLLLVAGAFVLFGGKIGKDYKFRWAAAMLFLTDAIRFYAQFLAKANYPWIPFFLNTLPVVTYSIFFFILLERVIEVMQKSYISSITDSLTGLYNRRHFYSTVEKAVSLGRPVSVIFSDIDNFKRVNDTKGHKAGDDILKQVASILKEELDGIGMAGRYGGEELVCLITNVSHDMKQLTERIRFRIEKETNPHVTASIGYCTFERGMTTEEIIKNADGAMYRAKTTGKNKVVRFAATTAVI